MLPQPPLPVTPAPISKDSETTSSTTSACLSLTDALRMSIAGESMEFEAAVSDGDLLASSKDQHSSGSDLFVPDDMPVDLRVKLALAMIFLGQQIPEVMCGPDFFAPA